VSVTVVNLESQVVFLGDANVFPEALALNLVKGLLRAEEIKTGFPDGDNAGLAGEPRNGFQGRRERPALMQPGCLIGVQGHCSEHSGLAGRECHRPLGCLNIGAYLNNPCYPDSFCPIEVLPVIHGVLTIGKFEVSVIVIDRNLKGLWFRRISQGSIASL
jgi:hypothetical protein